MNTITCLGCDRDFKTRQFNQKPICSACKKVYRLTNRAERRYRRRLQEDNVNRMAEAETKGYPKSDVVTPIMAERIIEWMGR